ncbi:MAG: DUF5667 domain-containing protein [Patescibacteria group bacterium]|nr:DUF5667 domain-containing protein [Patescibacteria group bacterium]
MQDIISKLNTLKSIEPEKNWVVETRKKVLSEAPDFGWKMTEIRDKQESGAADRFFSRKQINRDGDLSRLCNRDDVETAICRVSAISTNHDKRDKSVSLRKILFSKRLAVSAFALVFLISGGAFTVEASKSSLPGDSLYIVKIATEDATLAVASKNKRPEIEIEQAGRRLEELSKISKKSPVSDQGKKAEKLLASFERKVNNAQTGMLEIKDNGIKAKVAKAINVQTEKNTGVLAEAKESFPDVVKIEMSEKFANAVNSNEKVNFQSLATMVETMDKNEEEEQKEITTKVEKEINKLEEKIILDNESENSAEVKNDDEAKSGNESDDVSGNDEKLADTINEDDDIDDEVKNSENSEDSTLESDISAEDSKKELEKAKASLENNDLSGAMNAIANVNIALNLKDPEENPNSAGDESTEDGKVEGASSENKSEEGENGEDGEDLNEKSAS